MPGLAYSPCQQRTRALSSYTRVLGTRLYSPNLNSGTSFIAHCTAQVVGSLAPILRTGAAGADAPPPTAAAVGAAVQAAQAGITGELARAHGLMVGHLPEPSTQAILFAPIRQHVTMKAFLVIITVILTFSTAAG